MSHIDVPVKAATAMFVPRTKSAMAFRSSFVATPPVGLCGELRKIAFAFGSLSAGIEIGEILLLEPGESPTGAATLGWLTGAATGLTPEATTASTSYY